MKILHTADWHIGQYFYEHGRETEHRHFFEWLCKTIKQHDIDALLVSGDVFDHANPSASSFTLLYEFLKNLTITKPNLQVVMIAGNHDSPSRLEGPNPIFEFLNIRVVGSLNRTAEGKIDYEKLLIPLRNKTGEIAVWCMAVPYLRLGDYPTLDYVEGVTAIYKEVYEYALEQKQPTQAIVAMGHLHTAGVEANNEDERERPIVGGAEYLPTSIFPEGIAYTALGHIHKYQILGQHKNIAYSGSVLPMSFSEKKYEHRVVVVEFCDGKLINIQNIFIPKLIPLISVPTEHASLDEVVEALKKLPKHIPNEQAPYLEARVLLEKPEPHLRSTIENAVRGRHAQLCSINSLRREEEKNDNTKKYITIDEFRELKPETILREEYKRQYGGEITDSMITLFRKVEQNIAQEQIE